jgi:NitT/TauT family transport system ATP-binding protein
MRQCGFGKLALAAGGMQGKPGMTAAARMVIETRTLTKIYKANATPITAIEEISFAAEEGSFVSLVGPSGCGKSTLLQILAGLLPSSRGEVLVDGVPVRKPMPDKIAVVFQEATLLPWKTVIQNIEFPLEIQKVPHADRRDRARAMLALVGLADFADRYPFELSGGMRQRVSIARGLAQNPRIILMDEPFGALDEQTRLKMGHELLEIWSKTKKTIFMITHSLTEALFLSDIVLVMSQRPGRIVDVIRTELPRPRTYDMIGSPAFGEARNRIWKLIGGEEGLSRESASP